MSPCFKKQEPPYFNQLSITLEKQKNNTSVKLTTKNNRKYSKAQHRPGK